MTDTTGRPPESHVVVVGGGFGGLAAVRALRDAPVRVTLIDRSNHHLFQPLLYQVATGSLSPANVATPLRRILHKQRNARVLLAEVRDIDVRARRVLTDSVSVEYDALVVATGARHDYFGHDWDQLAPGLKTIVDATEIRRRVLGAFEAAELVGDPERAREWLTFVVVGGGPTGVELAGALADIARNTLTGDFSTIDPTTARILLVEGDSQILGSYTKGFAKRAQRALERLGVTVLTDARVVDVTPDYVEVQRTTARERIETHTVLWAAGVRASRLGLVLAEQTGAEVDRAGRIKVGPDLAVPGHPDIFVIGDLAHATDRSGKPLPGLAAVALQQGHYVAEVLKCRLRGQPVRPFRYRNRGTMAVVGRGFAVADLGRIRVWGFPGWLLWLGLHLAWLMEMENRLLVFIQWVWSYWTRGRSARLIVGPSPRPVGAEDAADLRRPVANQALEHERTEPHSELTAPGRQ